MTNNLVIQKKLSSTPSQTGCYLLKNKIEKILYIGKAKNLRQRISQHLQTNKAESGKFLGLIADWEIILTNNVKEALILEQSLVKKHRPRFNILLKDDHSYPYIKITGGDNPRYLLIRNIPINFNKEEVYFGPFPEGTKAREIIQILERLFPLAKCSGNLGKSYDFCKPCLYYSLKQCSGYCFKQVPKDYYQKTKKQIIAFFRGKNQTVKKKMENSLRANITNLEFELAKKEKRILDNLNFFVSPQSIEFVDRRNYDFLGFYYQKNFLTVFFFIYRYGRLSMVEKEIFKIHQYLLEKQEILFTYLYQFYQKNPPPEILYSPEMIDEEKILREKFGFRCQIPQRGKKKEILELAQRNAYQNWQKHYYLDFSKIDKIELLEELGNYLQIATPYFIEALDISNLFQADMVAGFLTCINGEIVRSKSHLYLLDDDQEMNDVAWISQACKKHYSRKKKLLPDLLIVDGGKAQIQAVLSALKSLNLAFPVIGLAKNDKHQTEKIIKSDLRSLEFGKKETIKLFLTNLQEEVHNYAISFHRKLHRKSSING